MAVRKRPQPAADVDSFIRSAPVQSGQGPAGNKEIQPVKLRIDGHLLAQIDAAVNARRPAPSRHQWILEAIYEKLEQTDTAKPKR